MGIGRCANLLTAIVLALTCAAAIVGTAGSQYRGDFRDGANNLYKNRVYLYASEQDVNDANEETTYFKRGDFACKSYYDKLTAAFALGLIAIVFSFIATLLAFFRICIRAINRWIVFVFALLAFMCLVCAFAISVSTYTMKQCGTESFKSRNYTIDWGLAVLIIAAGLGLIGTCFALIFSRPHDDQPKEQRVVHTDNIAHNNDPAHYGNPGYNTNTTTTNPM